jgi:FkbM family methyltransferase
MHKATDISPRETFYYKVLDIFGERFRLPGLRRLRNPFSLTLDMLLNRLLQRNIEKALVLDELWLKEKFKVEPSWTFIDIGANIGQWSLYMANRVHKVIAIEPVKEPFMWLRRNTKKFGNVLCLNVACWDVDKPVAMFVRPDWGFGRYEGDPNYTIRGLKLDTLLRIIPITGEVAIKIDVEGSEDRVLMGGKEALGFCRTLLVEVHGNKLEQIRDIVERHKFRNVEILRQANDPRVWLLALK